MLDSEVLQSGFLDFKSEFQKVLEREKSELPYRLNVLDEIRVNSGIIENAHNRILAKILAYSPDKKQHVVLQSFLKHLGSPFSELEVSKPEITAEKDRIDVRIRDTDYTIIIENKVKGAADQDRQIERYVEEEEERKAKNIHVLYLAESSGSPSDKSLSKVNEKKLGERYKKISYRRCIMPWL